MTRLRVLVSRLLSLFRRRRLEQELDEELRAHVEMQIEENLRKGMPPKEARYAALRAFGGVEQTKEAYRDQRGLPFLETLWADVRYGARMLRKSPGFTAVAVLTLAVGIGANTAIFSVVNTVLLRPLAYRDAGQLYLIEEIVPQWTKFAPLLSANLPDFRIWQKECHSFDSIAIADNARAILTGIGEAEQIPGVRASANLFDVLGVTPAIGRTFLPEEDETGRGQVVILTDAFWRSRFHGDPSLVGRAITLDGKPYVVVGILPGSFHFPTALAETSFGERIDFYEPLNGPREYEQALIGEFDYAAIGRLKSGVSPREALAELNVVQAQIAQQAKQGLDLQAAISPLESEVVRSARRGLILLLSAVGAVLLIVCANLANLSLTRIPGRMREAAIRVALGASRGRLFRRLLTESLLLGTLGGAVGLWLAYLGVHWLVRSAPTDLPRLDEVQMDGRVLGFAALLSILTAVLFGILPAWRVTKVDPLENLKSGGAASGESRRSRRLRETLIGFEVGLCTLLLIVAGLLTSSLAHLLRVNTGFAIEGVLTAQVTLPKQRYADAAGRLRFYSDLLERLRALPGVRAAGWVHILPLTGTGSVTGIDIPAGASASRPQAHYRAVSPGYFTAMGIPLIRGRVFSESDRGRKVVVVSESVAKRFWPGEDPIGRTCLTYWGPEEADEVIGVVGDIRTVRLDAPPVMMVYVLNWFDTAPQSAAIVVRTSGEEPGIAGAVRGAIHATDAEVPIVALRPMAHLVSESVAPRRFQMFLVLVFAGSALFLASLGIYGVIAYSVEQRSRELGIRAALGARSLELRRMVLRQGMTPALAGLATGIGASLFTGRLLRSLLFGVSPLDPVTLAAVSLVVSIIAAAASYLPARRATKVDPMVALRYE